MKRERWRTLPHETPAEKRVVAALAATFRAGAPEGFALEIEAPSVDTVDVVVRFEADGDEPWAAADQALDEALDRAAPE